MVTSTPTVASSRPISAPITPFSTFSLDTLATTLMPNRARAKLSWALNYRAKLDRMGEVHSSITAENSPPKVEAVVEMDRARPGWWCLWAMG